MSLGWKQIQTSEKQAIIDEASFLPLRGSQSDGLRRNMSASIGGLCQMWGIGCLLASEWAYGIHCAWGTPPRLFSLKLFGLRGSPRFSLQKLWDFKMYHLQCNEEKGAAKHIGGDRVRRSNFKVVCVWVCLHGKPGDGRTHVSKDTIQRAYT